MDFRCIEKMRWEPKLSRVLFSSEDGKFHACFVQKPLCLSFRYLCVCTMYVYIVVWLAGGGSGGSLFIRSGAAWRGVMPTTIGRGSRNGRNGPKGERGRIRRAGWSRGVTARERDGSEVSAVTDSPLHTPRHATCDFVVPRTLLCRWWKRVGMRAQK